MENSKAHVVYILECSDKTYYTGYTNDLEKRIAKHQTGKGAKYTRGRSPLKLMYAKGFATKEEAMKEEYRIKRLPRKEKEKLIVKGED